MRAMLPILVLALLASGCGSERTAAPTGSSTPIRSTCPPGWKKLARDVRADVYCPTWLPSPLDGRIGGEYANGRSIDPDRSYLVSFVWLERGVGEISGEVHVNFRGYPGQTRVPRCSDTLTVKGVTKRVDIPCFSDPRGFKAVGGERVQVYTVNQGADQWHVLYAWRHAGGLYTLSQHVIAPSPYSRVVSNLDRMMKGLVLVRPAQT